jgi:hypothetical protein
MRNNDMKIKEWYLEAYPTDELGTEINPNSNFGELWAAIRSDSFYEYIGVGDSIIRERVFEKLSELSGHDYHYIYEEWLSA